MTIGEVKISTVSGPYIPPVTEAALEKLGWTCSGARNWTYRHDPTGAHLSDAEVMEWALRNAEVVVLEFIRGWPNCNLPKIRKHLRLDHMKPDTTVTTVRALHDRGCIRYVGEGRGRCYEAV